MAAASSRDVQLAIDGASSPPTALATPHEGVLPSGTGSESGPADGMPSLLLHTVPALTPTPDATPSLGPVQDDQLVKEVYDVRSRERASAHALLAARRLHQIKNASALPEAYTPANLRRIFRLMDMDNNQELGAREVQAGLIAMGFSEAADQLVVSRLFEEIDEDHSGSINEREFVAFFQRLHKEDVQHKLAAYEAVRAEDELYTPTKVHVLRYSTRSLPHSVEGTKTERVTMAPSALPTYLDSFVLDSSIADADVHVWIDVVGYDAHLLSLLSTYFGIDPEVLKDAFTVQRQKAELHKPAQCILFPDAERSSVNVHPTTPVEDTPILSTSSDAGSATTERLGAVSPAAKPMTMHMLLHAMYLTHSPFVVSSLASRVSHLCDPCRPLTHSSARESIRSRYRNYEAALESARKLAATLSDNDPLADIVRTNVRRATLVENFEAFSGPDAIDSASFAEGIGTAVPRTPSGQAHSTRGSARCACMPGCCRARRSSVRMAKTNLATRTYLQSHLPDISQEQCSIIIINDRIMLTVRDAATPQQVKAAQARARLLTLGSVPSKSYVPSTVLSILFEAQRTRMRNMDEGNSYLFTAPITSFGLELVDTLQQYNFGIRDALRDWHDVVEAAVQRRATPMHTSHLYALAKVLSVYKNQLQPAHAFLRQVTSAVATDVTVAPGSADAELSKNVGVFFEEHRTMVQELYQDADYVFGDVIALEESVRNIRTLLTALQDEFTNKVLYLLTLVSFMSSIVAGTSGYFGMNFDDMIELRTADGGFGIRTFWAAVGILMGVVMLAVWRIGFFRAF